MSGALHLDLDAASREALEVRAILEFAASFAATRAGRELLTDAAPLASLEGVRAEHAAVEEAVRHLERLGRLLPGRLPDAQPALDALRVEGSRAEAPALRDLASVLLEASDLRRRLRALEGPGFDALSDVGRGMADLAEVARPLAEHIAPDGRIEDGASSELRRLRAAIAKAGERLRRQLESFVHDPAAASVVQDDFVTQRNGRYVIPVRADSPRPVRGIVHAASSSGQTLFVEPIESVGLNNDLVRLAEQEAAECDRIVRGWHDRLRDRLGDVTAAVAALARIDALQARALFAASIEGVLPTVEAGGGLRLDGVRHPLLDRRLREEGKRCVPISIELDAHQGALVVSGPNTGGKTVALKTVGVACVMAQYGLPVAARAARLPLFRQIRADIGDHQSIDADLSTFSGHVSAVARYLDEIAPPALFLFDEIGTGTEPGEGAALAQAVLERLLECGVTAVATTHHAALKAWAFAEARVASAAMEFDAETLRPTFRVLPGAAGASAGIEVASKLGLDRDVIGRARELVGREGIAAEAYMERLRALTTEAEQRARSLRVAEEALDDERERLREAELRESSRRREEVARALAAALAEFRVQSSRELASIQDARERERAERGHARAAARLRSASRRAQDTIVPDPSRTAPGTPPAIVPGAVVRIVSLERQGEVVRRRGEKVDVRMGVATFTVEASDLAAPLAEEAPPARPGRAARLAALAAASRGAAADAARELPAPEILLVGRTVDEALPDLERFLDRSAREGRFEVRVIHGHGTGRLRQGVRRFLEGHPLVAGFRPGGHGEGGDGATVVTLR